MRVAIISLKLHTNYGGLLQAFALQTALENLGHVVEVIQPYEEIIYPPYWKRPFSYTKRFVQKALKKELYVFKEKYILDRQKITRKNIADFEMAYLHIRRVKSLDSIKKDEYDAFVVGSDQVWRPLYFMAGWGETSMKNAFLKFTEGWNVRRVAYAASFGVDEWEFSDKETKICSDLAQKFSSISVREDSGVDLCKKHLNVEAVSVLDPTMLLSREDYLKVAKNTSEQKHSLFVYLLDKTNEMSDFVDRLSKEKALSVNELSCREDLYTKDLKVVPSVSEWLSSIKDAEFVVTDSFHACVFSIIFNKPFVVFLNKKRGSSRFFSLLKKFGLEKNILFSNCGYNPNASYSMSNEVEDYKKKMVEQSLQFLRLI